jgi:hypothetical protein
MPFKSFRDFDDLVDIQTGDYIVGYKELEREFKIKVEDLSTFLNRNQRSAPYNLYVHLSGSDQNNGETEGSAMRTIKRACAKALWISRNISQLRKDTEPGWGVFSQSVNIFVRAGDYVEDNPVYLPPGCTIIGDNLRAVTIIPKNKFYDIIWVNNRCYVWGATFRRHKYPSYAVAYPIFKFVGPGSNDSLSVAPPYKPDATGLNSYYYDNNKRIIRGIEQGTKWYELYPQFPSPRGDSYVPSRVTGTNLDNLSQDSGRPFPGDTVTGPFEIAFMTRYFKGIRNANFFTAGELDFGDLEFWQTQWYKRNIRRPYTLTSPYPQGNSSITQSTIEGADDAGGGVLVDGYDVDGPLRSMVMDSFTQFNEGGKGIHIVNNGYAQLVSTFTICCTEGVICETGGTCSINTSNCSFGLSGLVATGKSPRPTIIGRLETPISRLTNQVIINNLGPQAQRKDKPGEFYSFLQEDGFQADFQPYPGQVFALIDYTQNSQVGPLTAINSGSYFTILSASPLFRRTRINPSTGETEFIDQNFISVIQLEQNYSITDDLSITQDLETGVPYIYGDYDAQQQRTITRPVTAINAENTEAFFYIRSTITTSAHTMEYIGTGTTLLSAIPQKGGETDTSKEVVFDSVGRVFFTATNQFGDFRIGQGLTIVQATGTIEGDTFRRSILQTITPFTIAIGG